MHSEYGALLILLQGKKDNKELSLDKYYQSMYDIDRDSRFKPAMPKLV
jgi:hypothetical protein